MVKKSCFNGVVRIEFENAKTTEVAAFLTMNDCIVEIRHDAENPCNFLQVLLSDILEVRAGERLVLVMTEGYAKYGEILPSECDAVNNLYQVACRFEHDRLRVKIYANVEGSKSECVGYAWIGKGKGIAEGDATESAEDTDNTSDDFGFIGITLIVPKGYSNESKADEPNKPTEPKTANVTAVGVGYTIDAVITYTNPNVSAQTIIDTTDSLRRKLSDIITAWED